MGLIDLVRFHSWSSVFVASNTAQAYVQLSHTVATNVDICNFFKLSKAKFCFENSFSLKKKI